MKLLNAYVRGSSVIVLVPLSCRFLALHILFFLEHAGELRIIVLIEEKESHT